MLGGDRIPNSFALGDLSASTQVPRRCCQRIDVNAAFTGGHVAFRIDLIAGEEDAVFVFLGREQRALDRVERNTIHLDLDGKGGRPGVFAGLAVKDEDFVTAGGNGAGRPGCSLLRRFVEDFTETVSVEAEAATVGCGT